MGAPRKPLPMEQFYGDKGHDENNRSVTRKPWLQELDQDTGLADSHSYTLVTARLPIIQASEKR